MAEAYIVATARTAGGRKGGRLAGWHPADLAASVLDSLVERTGADPAQVEDVIMGCVMQAGEQSNNIARNAVMASKLPESVPATSIDRQCGSSQQALHFAAQAVMSRHHGLRDRRRRRIDDPGADGPRLVAAGQERLRPLQEPGHRGAYPNIMFSQFTGAEMMAEKYGLSKDELDEYSYNSHQRAIAATQAGALQGRNRSAADHPRRRLDRHPPHRRRHPLRRHARRHQGRQADPGRRQAHRRQRQPDLRRRLRRHDRQRTRPEVARRQADGADPSPDHDGRRSRDHAGSAAAGHPARAGEGRHERSTTSTCSKSTKPLPRCRPRG